MISLLGFQYVAHLQASAQNNDATEILNRYNQFLLITDTSKGNCSTFPPINADGRWSDINYQDDQPSKWQIANHIIRIRSLAMCLAQKHLSIDESMGTRKTVSLALNDWFVHRYQSKNWWYNEIGIPQFMRDIMVLMNDGLTQYERDQCLQILKQHRVRGTGANLVWSADLGLHYAAFTNDTALMRHCRDTILSVFKISTAEGVQPDYSFHQHGTRLQMYHYGGAFLLEDVRIAWQLQHTSLAFPADKIQLLTDFVLKGWQWMARGINTTPGTIDRAASRKNALHSADVRHLIPFMREIASDSANAFAKMLAIQNGQDALVGYRYFPYSDFAAYQQPIFSFFQKTNSPRTLLTESINEENLKGKLLNSGDSYFIIDGSEYFNLLPFWDWDHLPGTTNFVSGKSQIVAKSFVGNVSDGFCGLSAMDYELKQDQDSLTAKKCWASWKNITVALIAGLKSNATVTTMEQSRWQGKVVVDGAGNIQQEGAHLYKKVKWIYHHQFVYIPITNDSVRLELKTVNASWYDINHAESPAILSDKVFEPLLIHHSANAGYVVAYAPVVDDAGKIVSHPSWKVLRNDTACQAIHFRDGTTMAAFYIGGKFKLDNNLSITVSKPCLLLWHDNRFFVSDPSHAGGDLLIKINNTQQNVLLPSDGTTVEFSR
jgi:chondroitin AC lyase